MDVWVVGVAAAVGSIAKHWQANSKHDSDTSTKVLRYENAEIPSCPIRRLIRRKKLLKDSGTDKRIGLEDRHPDVSIDGHSESNAVSASGYGEKPVGFEDHQDWNAPLGSTFQPAFTMAETLEETIGTRDSRAGMIDYSVKHCSGGLDFSNGIRSNRSSRRSRYLRSNLIKPINSLESCLVAQLWNERTEMEEYVLRALPSPSTTMRPLIVTNGSQIISRSSLDSWCTSNKSGVSKETVYGVPPLPKCRRSGLAKEGKSQRGKECCEKLNCLNESSKVPPQLGLIDEKVLFFLGISLGVMSSLVANKRDVDRLKESLKQTKNLVQDLQEELEMKDALTVKELANENYKSHVTSENSSDRLASNLICPAQEARKSIENLSKEFNNLKTKSPECMSNIEAELEAELERLGLNISASSLEKRLSNIVELDPDFVADFAQGELKADKLKKESEQLSMAEKDASGTSTAHTENTAVSARELSLRLHEVIQSRLEARIRELETALESSQKKVQLMQSGGHTIVRGLSSRDLRYSSGEESPVSQGDFSSVAQPVVMELSGEALDAYNEAYEELSKTNESGEYDSPVSFYDSMPGRNGVPDGSIQQRKEESRREEDLDSSIFQELQYSDVESEEDSDSNELLEKLIKEIVERTKKGSPAVINAQRVLCSMDDSQH